MNEAPKAADNTGAPLTVEAAANQFASLLTPQGQEDRREQAPQGAAVEESDATPSPEDRPEETTDATEADAEPEASDDVAFTVLEDGKEIPVSREEARLGYMRQRDATRKWQEAAELKKQSTAEAESLRGQRTQYQEQLASLRKAMEAMTPPEPDWDTLRREDPNDYAIKRLEWNEHRDRIAQVQAEQDRVAQEQADDFRKQAQAKAGEEHEKLLLAVPEWKDQAKAKSDMEQMAQHAKTAYGFSDADLAQIADHRAVLVLRDAMRFRALEAKKPDVRKKIAQVKTATPGGLKTPEKGAHYQRALDQLAKSGRTKDAAAAFNLLGASGDNSE